MVNIAELLETPAHGPESETIFVTSSDFGMRIIAYRASNPAKPQAGDSAEEAIGKLLFSPEANTTTKRSAQEPLLVTGSSFAELGLKVISGVRDGSLAMNIHMFSSDAVV